MSTSTTTNIALVKDNADEPVRNYREHRNSNMDAIDAQIQSLKDVIANAKALLGQLGLDASGDPVVDATTARANLDVPSTTDLANIDSSIAPVESTTATANHAAGDYFMLGNVLMEATSAIATDEQITTSNATPATIQGQIDTLRDSVANHVPFRWVKDVSVQSHSTPYHQWRMHVVFRDDVERAIIVRDTGIEVCSVKNGAYNKLWSVGS